MNEKNKNIVGMITCAVIGILVGGGIIYCLINSNIITLKSLSSKTNSDCTNIESKKSSSGNEVTENSNQASTDESESVQNTNATAPKCTGTYVSEETSLSYTLNSDGTYTRKDGDVVHEGYFMINENTISISERKHATGPRDQDPVYSTTDDIIADDCSYFIHNSYVYRKTN